MNFNVELAVSIQSFFKFLKKKVFVAFHPRAVPFYSVCNDSFIYCISFNFVIFMFIYFLLARARNEFTTHD